MSSPSDPRVFFAAERTLLAWSRSSLALMAFGFVIERFGLFVQLFQPSSSDDPVVRGAPYWVGLAFILLGAVTSLVSVVQFRELLKHLKPVEIPQRYVIQLGIITNMLVSLLGVALLAYLFMDA